MSITLWHNKNRLTTMFHYIFQYFMVLILYCLHINALWDWFAIWFGFGHTSPQTSCSAKDEVFGG